MSQSAAFALILPLLLLAGQTLIFRLSARWLGAQAGYLLGFGCYWLFWRLLVPRLLLGKAEFGSILRDRAPCSAGPTDLPPGSGSRSTWLSFSCTPGSSSAPR